MSPNSGKLELEGNPSSSLKTAYSVCLSPLPQPFKCYASINGQMLKCLNVFENQCSKRGAETSTHFVTNSKTLCFAKDSSGRSIQQKINTYRSQYLEFFHVHNFSLVRHIFHESRVFRSRCVTGTFLFAINRWKWRLNKNLLSRSCHSRQTIPSHSHSTCGEDREELEQ